MFNGDKARKRLSHGAGVSAAATAALTAVMSNPAMALVDES
jgi:hypothetical protein